ncbi:glycine--tRNA ligase subunit beta [Myxococcota bacterium]|nr:glycine--tRNA ligase subunit beta [Myxococcota bacterium]MBU1536247.1 glycine--tRNA ligase subunit beta [Myxococcota bacterium]
MRFVLELLCEEIPVAEQQRFAAETPKIFTALLEKERIGYGAVITHTTPRRLAIICEEMDETQQSLEEELAGPPESIAFKDGAPTKAAQGFAAKTGVAVEDLHRIEKGGKVYLAAWNRQEGRASVTVLPEIIVEFIGRIPFRKSMRWGENAFSFSRPLKGILALLGSEVVPLQTHGVKSGRRTYGHRFHYPQPVDCDQASNYETLLRSRGVVVKVEKRLALIREEIRALAEAAGLTLIENEDLLAEVALLVESPTVVLGSFSEDFLAVPREVIISAMAKHQRYFGFEKEGKLAPRFATVLGTRIDDPRVALDGNERVLSARLSDARFFWDEDRKNPLSSHEKHMKTMVYHRKLGTLLDRIHRIERLAGYLSPHLGAAENLVSRAARLCKMDLDTHMVYEFPELQGVMGQRYAEVQGEDPGVSLAICEHYMPKSAGSPLPTTPVGACVALADKLDAITGGIAAGLKPTGSADPFALRRAALGLLRIMIERRIDLDLSQLVSVGASMQPIPADEDEVKGFLLDRLRTVMGENAPKEMVEAVLASGHEVPYKAMEILAAINSMGQSEAFLSLVRLFKRMNILKKADIIPETVDPGLFTHDAERDLFTSLTTASLSLEKYLETGEYLRAIELLVPLYPYVDTFFDDNRGVRVMDDDPKIRGNRFALLAFLDKLFRQVADFKLLAGLT